MNVRVVGVGSELKTLTMKTDVCVALQNRTKWNLIVYFLE